MVTNYTQSVLYVGVTNDIQRRMYEYRNRPGYTKESFVTQNNCYRLVHLEQVESSVDAIKREKQIKKWSRQKKENLINIYNPNWCDLVTEYNLD